MTENGQGRASVEKTFLKISIGVVLELDLPLPGDLVLYWPSMGSSTILCITLESIWAENHVGL